MVSDELMMDASSFQRSRSVRSLARPGIMPMLLGITRRLLQISPLEVSTAKRRFQVDDGEKQERIESVGAYFLVGYHAAINTSLLGQLCSELESVPLEYQGFAYEGAAMGLCLLERLLPGRSPRFHQFLLSEWNHFPYLSHVGMGWALARIPGGVTRFAKQLLTAQFFDAEAGSPQSLLSCLVLDGYGFHQGFFAWEKHVQAMVEPGHLPKECLPVFRQGVGRSLSFVLGMNGSRIAHAIERFPPSRQSDLWSGVGLASAYAGGLGEEDLNQLTHHAGEALPAFAQGIAFAAKARHRANHVPDHTHRVCQMVWRRSVESVALLTDSTLERLPHSSPLASYGAWRMRLQHAFVSAVA